MTCLTYELKNQSSPLYQWFASQSNYSGECLIQSHNCKMDTSPLIRPTGQIKDLALVGTAFIYAFRWHLGLLGRCFAQTAASQRLDFTIANQLLQAQTNQEKAVACLIFAAFEREYRSGSPHELATVLMKNNGSELQLKPEFNYALSMIDDLVNLINSLPSVWSITERDLSSRECFVNATFSGSDYIPADAQQIIDGTLIKCFTTLRKSSFTREHFWQQIAYVLMDWENEYKLDKICWYYSRQKALFVYPLDSFFKDLPKSRAEFRDFVTDNYYDDEDEYDYFFS